MKAESSRRRDMAIHVSVMELDLGMPFNEASKLGHSLRKKPLVEVRRVFSDTKARWDAHKASAKATGAA